MSGMRCLILLLVFVVIACTREKSESNTAPATPKEEASSLQGSAILDVFSGAPERYPKSLADMRDKFERIVQLKWLSDQVRTNYIVQSSAPAATSAEEPRGLYESTGAQLFMAAITRLSGEIDFEFISWNERRQAYDFGLVTHFGTPQAKVELADRRACMKCHISGGPHYMENDWRFSQDNMKNIHAVLLARAKLEKDYQPLKELVEKLDPNKDVFDDKEVLAFFKKRPDLLRWNGLDLHRIIVEPDFNPPGGFTARNFEDRLIDGAIRTAVANYRATLSPEKRKKFAADLVHMRVRALFNKEALPEHMALSHEVKDSPGHFPALFSKDIEPGRKLLPTDFVPDSKPLDPAHGEAINSGSDWLAKQTRALMRADFSVQQRWEKAAVIWKTHALETYAHLGVKAADPQEAMAMAVLRAPLFSNRIVRSRILTEGDFQVGISEALGLIESGWIPSMDTKNPWELTNPEEEAQEKINVTVDQGACLTCHKTMGGNLRFEFRVDDPREWLAKVEKLQEESKPRLRSLRSAIVTRLSNEDDPMPPQDSDEWKAFSPKQRAELVEFLQKLEI